MALANLGCKMCKEIHPLTNQQWTFVFYIAEYSAAKEISDGTTEFLIASERA